MMSHDDPIVTAVKILDVSPERLSFLTDKGILNVRVDPNERCIAERDIQTFVYRFHDENKTAITFRKSGIFSFIFRAKAYRNFHDLYKMIIKCGHTTLDAS